MTTNDNRFTALLRRILITLYYIQCAKIYNCQCCKCRRQSTQCSLLTRNGSKL